MGVDKIMKKKIKVSLVRAIWIASGVVLGAVLLPRLINPEMYNETYAILLKHCLFAFFVSYAASAIVYFLIELLSKNTQK